MRHSGSDTPIEKGVASRSWKDWGTVTSSSTPRAFGGGCIIPDPRNKQSCRVCNAADVQRSETLDPRAARSASSILAASLRTESSTASLRRMAQDRCWAIRRKSVT